MFGRIVAAALFAVCATGAVAQDATTRLITNSTLMLAASVDCPGVAFKKGRKAEISSFMDAAASALPDADVRRAILNAVLSFRSGEYTCDQIVREFTYFLEKK